MLNSKVVKSSIILISFLLFLFLCICLFSRVIIMLPFKQDLLMRNLLQFEEKTPFQTLAKIFEASSILFTVMAVSLSPDCSTPSVLQ